MSEIVIKLGERIRHLRKEKGMSQELLGELSGLHTNYIGQVERGEKNVTIESLEKIAAGLDVSLEQLFRYTDPMRYTDEIQNLVQMLEERSIQDKQLALHLIKSVFDWEKQKHST